MAEVFATVAGVGSSIDVALRACNALCDAIRYLKDAPELSQRLQRNVQSVESILQTLEAFVAQYRRSQALTGQSGFLPDAVTHEIISIKTELEALSTLLPAASSSDQLRRRLKWVLDRKKVAEVLQRLEGHQITLILALQSFAQQNDIQFYEDLLRLLGQIQGQGNQTVKEFKTELGSVSTGLRAQLDVITQTGEKSVVAQEELIRGSANLHQLVSAGQNAANDKLDAIGASLSQMQVGSGHVRSSIALTAPTEDVLARVFRAELRRVVMPTVKHCFDTFKSSPDSQLDAILKKIDEMARQLGTESPADAKDNVESSQHSTLEATSAPAVGNWPDDVAPSGLENIEHDVPKHRNESSLRYSHWRRTWIFQWAIGTLRVAFSTCTTKRKTSPVFRIGKVPITQKTYRITIEFLPAQSLVQLRGLTLSVASTQDQRGYYQICPLISSFAVVPSHAPVMFFARTNNVKGIQYLFEKRLAAPSDRDESGRTPLMRAAFAGASEVCHILLSEGSDPLAVNQYGWTSFDYSNLGFWIKPPSRVGGETNSEDREYVAVVQLLQQAESDIMESFNQFRFVRHMVECQIAKRSLSINSLLYLQAIRDSGFRFDSHPPDDGGAILLFVDCTCSSVERLSANVLREVLQSLLEFGADICGADTYGRQPLHWVFLYECTEVRVLNLIETATALLQCGADPCALDNNGYSSFDWAEMNGSTREWHKALEKVGFDVQEVQVESEQRQWCYRSGHGFAESTAVDEDQIAWPSTEGLVRRKAVPGDRLED